MKFGFFDEHRGVWPVRMMCRVLGLSASGYYAWRVRPESPRAAANRALIENIQGLTRDGRRSNVHALTNEVGNMPGITQVVSPLRRPKNITGRC